MYGRAKPYTSLHPPLHPHPPTLPPVPAVKDICRAAEEVFDHGNHFDHLHAVRQGG